MLKMNDELGYSLRPEVMHHAGEKMTGIDRLINGKQPKEYRRRRYPVYIRRAVKGSIYNVSDTPDVVYNILEDSYETTADADYIVTGLLGEMWPIKKESLAGYDVSPEEIDDEPRQFFSKSSDIVFYAVQISGEFELELEDGIVLKGNRPGIEHGEGDYILWTSLEKQDYRIINGKIFTSMYEEYEKWQQKT